MKLEEQAPQVGNHYRSEYQLHTAEDQPFGEKVRLEFKVEADQEESAMFDSLMESMALDKDGKGLNELDFNAPADKEERMSMMINQKADAFGNEAAAAAALAGSAQVDPVQPQAPAQPQAPISYGQLSAQVAARLPPAQPDPQSIPAPQAQPPVGVVAYGAAFPSNHASG